jgi:hypothetical protein
MVLAAKLLLSFSEAMVKLSISSGRTSKAPGRSLIESQNLQSLAACDLSGLLGDSARVQTVKLQTAKSLDPQISFVQSAQSMLVSASGGVMIESWYFASNIKENDTIAQARVTKPSLDSAASWYR